MIPAAESESNRRKNKSGDYEVSPQARGDKADRNMCMNACILR